VRQTATPDTTGKLSQESTTMTDRIETAHFVRIRYHGATNYKPSRLSASWEGWPTQGAKIVRRFMPYTSERDDMARTAAQLFTDWLSAMPGDDDPLRYSPAQLTLASMGNDGWALLVKTHVTPRAKYAIT
jgi:hypothetical protein